ncbi:MAG: hypothetical protein QMC80_04735 [Thermoplasmatales archaeon]|nr:hypothetical protein [Thermoplasmatales archaeon]
MQIKKKFVALGVIIMIIGVAIVIHGAIEHNRWDDEYNKYQDIWQGSAPGSQEGSDAFDKMGEAAEKSF